METLSVEIPIADVWPTGSELDARDSIITELTASGKMTCDGCGSGRGSVDFTLLVSDSSSATSLILAAVEKYMAGSTAKIRRLL